MRPGSGKPHYLRDGGGHRDRRRWGRGASRRRVGRGPPARSGKRRAGRRSRGGARAGEEDPGLRGRPLQRPPAARGAGAFRLLLAAPARRPLPRPLSARRAACLLRGDPREGPFAKRRSRRSSTRPRTGPGTCATRSSRTRGPPGPRCAPRCPSGGSRSGRTVVSTSASTRIRSPPPASSSPPGAARSSRAERTRPGSNGPPPWATRSVLSVPHSFRSPAHRPPTRRSPGSLSRRRSRPRAAASRSRPAAGSSSPTRAGAARPSSTYRTSPRGRSRKAGPSP